jgi:AraC family transcriptional regulator
MKKPASETKPRYSYGRYTDSLTSKSAGWQSLLVRIREWEISETTVETQSCNDPSIHLLIDKTMLVDHFSDGQWRRQRYTRGTGLLSPGGGHQRRLRLHFTGDARLDVLSLVLPQQTVDRVAHEVFTPSSSLRRPLHDIPFLDDRSISAFSSSVLAALRKGAPEFYAQSAAQWLAAHLLLGPFNASEWHRSLTHERVSDARLIRVLEYIDAHLSENLDLHVLSREAGLSPFHFAALFSRAVGATPHRHVTHLRMRTARSMLRETETSILEIALTCGFGSASHFASAFRREFSQSPTEYRSSERLEQRSF